MRSSSIAWYANSLKEINELITKGILPTHNNYYGKIGAKIVALLAEQKWANIFTTNIRKENRDKKIFVDYLRNGKGATCVCPFSLRAREGAKISMPIQWKDLEKIKPNDVNIFNFKEYLKISPWKNFFKNKQKIFE